MFTLNPSNSKALIMIGKLRWALAMTGTAAIALLLSLGPVSSEDPTRCLSGVCVGQPLDQVKVDWAEEAHVPNELRALMKLYLGVEIATHLKRRGPIPDALRTTFPDLDEDTYGMIAAAEAPSIADYFVTQGSQPVLTGINKICRFTTLAGQFLSENGRLTTVYFVPDWSAEWSGGDNQFVVNAIRRQYLGVKLYAPEAEQLISEFKRQFPEIDNYARSTMRSVERSIAQGLSYSQEPPYYYDDDGEGLYLVLQHPDVPFLWGEPTRAWFESGLAQQPFCSKATID